MFSITNKANVFFFFLWFRHQFQGYLLTIVKQLDLYYLDVWSDIYIRFALY